MLIRKHGKIQGLPVIRKWHRGVGIRDATRPIRSLFMYPGYRRVVVDAAMTVDTREFSWFTVGFCSFNLCVESGKRGGELLWYMIYSCKICFHYTIE
jgi:hypothetical protein